MTQTTVYRNDITGYTVTLVDYDGYSTARVMDSKGYDFPMCGVSYKHAALLAASRAKLNDATLAAR